MIKEIWNMFPRLLEQKINSLLDEAEPNATKAFQLYKTCQTENLWNDTFEKFSAHLNHFFSLPRGERRKSDLDSVLDKPLSMYAYEQFELNFHNALVSSRAISNIASWAHHLIRVSYKTESVVISTDVISRALQYVTHPPVFEKSKDLTFDDFCSAWKKTVFKLFGKKYDPEFEAILTELHWLYSQQQSQEIDRENTELVPLPFYPTIYLTQTEIDWTEAVELAVFNHQAIPSFPLSRGPQKPRLQELERTISLYRIVQTTQLPELLKHRDNIRATILDRCRRLINDCVR